MKCRGDVICLKGLLYNNWKYVLLVTIFIISFLFPLKKSIIIRIDFVKVFVIVAGIIILAKKMYRIIKDYKENKKKLLIQKIYFEKLFDKSPLGISMLDNQGKILKINKVFEKMFGYTEKEAIGKYIDDLIVSTKWKEEAKDFSKQVITGKPTRLETVRHHKSGKPINVEIIGFNMKFNKQILGVFAIYSDISVRKQAEKKLSYMEYHDSLTKLPNKYLFYKILDQSILRNNNKKLAVFFIDLDRFKRINDAMGHDFGDSLLIQVANRLVNLVSYKDFVSRFGGDEFLLLVEYTEQKQVMNLATKIIDEFSIPFSVKKEETFITPSIGISLYPEDSNDPDTLIKHADIAMHHAKEQGKNNYQFYSDDLEKSMSKKLTLENSLRYALNNNELRIHYQPQIDLRSCKVVGMEALLRWEHPEIGTVPPSEFIPLAEETGLIVPIGEWVFDTVCGQIKCWQNEGIPQVRVAVNVSIRQFQQDDFVKMVDKTIKKYKINPEYLELEITESIMQNIDDLPYIIKQLKDIGVQISVDDFGTGYSSLNLLKNLPIDNLKIDRSFINDILFHPNTAKLVRTIINMGYNLNFNVIAEGIENEMQVSFLKDNRCNMGQGYYFRPPIPPEKVTEVL